MYGVKPTLDLSRFHGATLVQVAVGQYEIILNFHPEQSLSIEGRYEVEAPDGALLEAGGRPDEFRTRHLLDLLGLAVEATTIEAPRAFVLQFAGGASVRFIDDSDRFESFTIQPGDTVI